MPTPITVAILQDCPFGRAGQVRELAEPWAQAAEARGEVTSAAWLVAEALALQGGVMIATEEAAQQAAAAPAEPAPAAPEAPAVEPAAAPAAAPDYFPASAQDYSPI